MIDLSDLIRRGNDLKAQAAQEPDATIRARLIRMAEDYARLAQAEGDKQAHPVDVASLGEIFGTRN